MVVCFLALGVFSVLGLFSLKYRRLAGEAFDCVFRRLTFRPCVSRLDERIKAKIVAKILPKTPRFARFVSRNFEILSWVFVLLSLASLALSAQGIANFYLYGNCNGPNEPGFCVFDPTGEGQKYSSCGNQSVTSSLSLDGVDLSIFPAVNRGAKNTAVFIGCFSCEYTKKAYPEIRVLGERADTAFILTHLPVKDKTLFASNAMNCAGERFIELSDEIFSRESFSGTEEELILASAEKVGFERTAFLSCVNSPETNALSERQLAEIRKTGVYGTPTVFVNGDAIVGPKNSRVYLLALN